MQDRAPIPVTWDQLPDDPTKLPFVLLVEAGQGQGKTHLAYTFPQPIFHLDTENRGDKVGAKFAQAGTEAYWKRCADFDSLRRTLNDLIFPHHVSGTIIIDSASDLQAYAEAEWLVEAKAKKVWPQTLWGEVYSKMDGLIEAVRSRGFHLVFTARRKAEYQNDKATGQLVLDGYKRLPYLSDLHLLLENGKAVVLKNGFRTTPEERTEVIVHPTFDTIHQELIAPAGSTAFEGESLDNHHGGSPRSPQPSIRAAEHRVLEAVERRGMSRQDLDRWLAAKGKALVELSDAQLERLALQLANPAGAA